MSRDESLPIGDVTREQLGRAQAAARAQDLDALLAEADAAADPAVPLDRLAHGGALIRRLAAALREARAEAQRLRGAQETTRQRLVGIE